VAAHLPKAGKTFFSKYHVEQRTSTRKTQRPQKGNSAQHVAPAQLVTAELSHQCNHFPGRKASSCQEREQRVHRPSRERGVNSRAGRSASTVLRVPVPTHRLIPGTDGVKGTPRHGAQGHLRHCSQLIVSKANYNVVILSLK